MIIIWRLECKVLNSRTSSSSQYNLQGQESVIKALSGCSSASRASPHCLPQVRAGGQVGKPMRNACDNSWWWAVADTGAGEEKWESCLMMSWGLTQDCLYPPPPAPPSPPDSNLCFAFCLWQPNLLSGEQKRASVNRSICVTPITHWSNVTSFPLRSVCLTQRELQQALNWWLTPSHFWLTANLAGRNSPTFFFFFFKSRLIHRNSFKAQGRETAHHTPQHTSPGNL